ncbi:MAG: PDZ domain-containing protein [bacterium]|nr:PDZ domain-containing protein [bacterium]
MDVNPKDGAITLADGGQSQRMNFTESPRVLAAIALVILVSGATAGLLFGARPEVANEEDVALRSARIVSHLLEWLPDETDSAEIVYDGIGGMLQVLDPHSNFLDPRNFQRMRAKQEGSFFGVGIIISTRNGQVTVIAPMAGTPAASKGLRAGDVIHAIEGELTEDLVLDDVVDRVRGPEGSEVHLSIQRPGMSEPFEVTIERARIPTNSVQFAFMIRPEVGYIRLTEFTNTSVEEVAEAIRALEEQGLNSLVFDLRNNPGGGLEAAVGISDLFVRRGQMIVSTRGRTRESHSEFAAPGGPISFDGPLVLLVNQGSASASEIVAGAVQDHDRGLVVGDITWGKGLVQTVFSVRDTGLALTTARYYTSSGRCIQRDYGSFIDYVTHRNGVSGPDATEEIFATDAGRTVLGGGGITPDVTIEGRELSEPVVVLYGSSAFFRFAIELLKDVEADEKNDFAQAFQASDIVMHRFWTFVQDAEIIDGTAVETIKVDDLALSDVRRALRVEVLNSTLGLIEGYKVAVGGDDQIQAALSHLPDAADFWHAWEENGSHSQPAGPSSSQRVRKGD